MKNKKVEPNEQIRGDVARIYMYKEQSYPKYIKFEDRIKKLIDKWDKDDPIND
ncbi:MAG: endonuclease [Dehalococcoidia bacterium]